MCLPALFSPPTAFGIVLGLNTVVYLSASGSVGQAEIQSPVCSLQPVQPLTDPRYGMKTESPFPAVQWDTAGNRVLQDRLSFPIGGVFQ